jgi:hypothetical protein
MFFTGGEDENMMTFRGTTRLTFRVRAGKQFGRAEKTTPKGIVALLKGLRSED